MAKKKSMRTKLKPYRFAVSADKTNVGLEWSDDEGKRHSVSETFYSEEEAEVAFKEIQKAVKKR